MLKKITLAILGISISGFAFAGTMGPTCAPGDVTVPCENNRWDLGVQALYLKTAYSGNVTFDPDFTNQPNNNNDWGWGYRLEGSYHFRTGNDITMNWLHYNIDSDSGLYTGAFPLSSVGIVAAPYALSISNKLDQVNLVFGQHVDMSQRKHARFYAGLQYGNILVDGDVTYAASARVTALTRGVFSYENNDFRGVGPTLGIDYSYDLTSDFSITANMASSILYGTSRHRDSIFYGNGLVAQSIYGSQKALVPSFEAKLGANYAHPIWQGMLNLEGGYQVINYFNAINGFQTFAVEPELRQSDFGLYGPYVGLKWLGNV